jgi:hypothetical protein
MIKGLSESSQNWLESDKRSVFLEYMFTGKLRKGFEYMLKKNDITDEEEKSNVK